MTPSVIESPKISTLSGEGSASATTAPASSCSPVKTTRDEFPAASQRLPPSVLDFTMTSRKWKGRSPCVLFGGTAIEMTPAASVSRVKGELSMRQ